MKKIFSLLIILIFAVSMCSCSDNAKKTNSASDKSTAVDSGEKSNVQKPSTDEQKNAFEDAQNYLEYMAFSYEGLIAQLEHDGYSRADAAIAVDNCTVDWNEQALTKALSYLEYSSFSRKGLIGQLEYNMFTDEQVAYAVENCNVSWKEQAVKTAERYLEYSSYKREELITQLEFEGFSKEEAEYAADQSGLK